MGAFSPGSLVSPLIPIPRGTPSGQLIPVMPTGSATIVASSNGFEYFMPIDTLDSVPIDRIVCEIATTIGSAGSLIRAGIYADDGTLRRPGGPPLLDAGTISGEVLGLREWTIAHTILPGRTWISVVSQGAPVTDPQFRVALGAYRTIPVPPGGTLILQTMIRRAGITGALTPITNATVFSPINFGHELYLRAA